MVHFAEADDTSGFFPQLGRWHDRDRYRMIFATLKPMASWLRRFMESEGVACFSCDAGGRQTYLLALGRLVRFLRVERVDIMHTHLFDPSTVGLLAAVVARTPVRIMTRHHSNYHTRIGRRWHVGVDQLCNRLSQAVIAVSKHTAEHIIHVEGASSEKVHAVVNGIDLSRVKVSSIDIPVRLRHELARGADVLLIPARLHPEKGQTYLFKALPAIRRLVKRPVVVLIAGAGPFDAAYRAEVQSLGCEDIVRFLGFRRDLPDLIAAADLVVLPSLAEAFGLAVAEALYLGTPVVATTVGGIPEIIEDGVDGVLVPPGNPDALAHVVVDLLNNREKRQRLAGAGRDRIADRFGFEKMMRAYEGIYEAVLSSR